MINKNDTETFLSHLNSIKPGTVIPKPEAKSPFRVKGWGTRRGERALVYFIPNHNNASKPYEKGITLSEWKKAFERLVINGEFSKEWFEKDLAACAIEGGCNFTTIGGLFIHAGVAKYEKKESIRNPDDNAHRISLFHELEI